MNCTVEYSIVLLIILQKYVFLWQHSSSVLSLLYTKLKIWWFWAPRWFSLIALSIYCIIYLVYRSWKDIWYLLSLGYTLFITYCIILTLFSKSYWNSIVTLNIEKASIKNPVFRLYSLYYLLYFAHFPQKPSVFILECFND